MYRTKKEELYRSKFITMEEALSKIKSGDTIAIGSYGNEPMEFLGKLHTIAERNVTDVTIWLGNPYGDYPFISMDGLEGKLNILSIFYGPALRKNHHTKRISFVPNNLHSCYQVILNGKRPNVFVAAVSPIDKYGCVCMSMSQQMELEMLDTCETIIFEVNRRIPRTTGTVRIPIEKVDYFIETDYEISRPPVYEITEVESTIAKNVASLIKDGDTIQFGIGGLPDAVAEELMNHNDLGIYTEMIGTSMGKLMWAGVVNNSRKNFFRGRTVGAFAWGSQDLYDYLDENPMVNILPVNYVNDPFNIAKNHNMVSVNTAIQIDLTGQVCSESIGYRQYSGTGGATDFAYGAYHAPGGRGIIAISSTAKKGTISRIVPCLDYGAVVSISRNIVDYVVTEYGIARLRDRPIRDRVDALISIAHPKFRDELREKANEYQIW
ncbi:MAG: acetyl-CoA hydrolase/transferase family protein [Oscillospiraceae bacterium]|jgi:acyl-CoA hydrolase